MEIEDSIFIELEDEPLVMEIVLYKDGTSKRNFYTEDGKLL